MRDIQTILGHSSLAMTERYTHVLLDDLRAGITALGHRQERLVRELGQPVGSGDRDIAVPAADSS